MRVTWKKSMKGKLLSVMLIISLVMVLILILSEQRRASEIEEEDREYRSEHSLFETIVVGGRLLQGTSAFGDSISGGYLLEIDGRYEEENYWFSTKTHHFVVKYPEAVPLRECEYIAGYLREAETALYSDDGINPDTGKSWEDYFDIKSWASMYLMQDFMTQWDVESFSFFLYKDADDPHLYCGPVWDFDLSMGATGLGKLPDVMRLSIWLREHRQGWLTELEKFPAFTKTLESFAGKRFSPF